MKQQVAVTGFGAVITDATGAPIGGWSSRSRGSGVFSAIPAGHAGILDLVPREGQGLFNQISGDQYARRSVVWGVSKNNFGAFEGAVGERGIGFFSDYTAHYLAARFGACGQTLCPVAACATGSHAVILGARLIESGEADVVLCGATEPPQHPMVLAAYAQMGALSKSGVMRPFDARRDGFVPGSGSGFLLLESLAHAQSRGAKVHARVSGYSMRADATHMTSMAPGGDSIIRAVEEASAQAGHPALGYINAHGTATAQNDAVEARALCRLFGATVPVSSTKALTGHLLGASGAVEAALCVLALKRGVLPPTLGLEESAFELDIVREERAGKVESVLSLNYGFGGHVGALVFDKMHSHREHGGVHG